MYYNRLNKNITYNALRNTCLKENKEVILRSSGVARMFSPWITDSPAPSFFFIFLFAFSLCLSGPPLAPGHCPPMQPRGGGGTHIFGRTGMCRSNGSLSYKKSLNTGRVFYQKILKHGSTFLTEPKFLSFRMAKTLKIAKFLKNGPIFQEKSLKMSTLFC